MRKFSLGIDLMVAANEPPEPDMLDFESWPLVQESPLGNSCLSIYWYTLHHVWNTVCKSTVTNMKTVQNFEVISNNKNVVSVLEKYVLHRHSNNSTSAGLEIYALGKEA